MLPFSRLAVPVVAALALTACSSGGDTGDPTSAPPTPAAQTLPAQTTEALETQLTKTMARNNVPGGAVEVCVPGYEDWATAQGVADVDSDTAMTTDMYWPLRSVTKSVTVTLLLELVDEGKVSLDDTIDKWVDGVPNGDTVTLRQLADMSSGVPEYTTQAWIEDYVADPERAFTTQELIDYANAEPAQFAPGAQKVYTNTNTLLLGEVVAQEYGQPFDQVVTERIVQQLGLDQTRYETAVNDWPGEHPTGYQPDDQGQLQPQDNNFTTLGPAGAMTSTLPDMCRWGAALGSGELLESATQQARLQGAPLDKGPEYDTYGLGIGTLEGWVGHTGEGFGHTVLVMHNPASGATVAVGMNVSNLGKHAPTRYFRKIAPIVDAVPPAA
ncbi:MAG: beta-lactamase family protein [Micrococcales bacterium]|nr:beta-lactamase family protein [Micrococcales bacterium]